MKITLVEYQEKGDEFTFFFDYEPEPWSAYEFGVESKTYKELKSLEKKLRKAITDTNRKLEK